ncbi:MAG TPA: recombination regulator RecX [Burkholderiaceae bacterium]|nr:recombination regulator RecX [Burkholderiaceae bacterium]
MSQPNTTAPGLSLKARALRWLSQREHSRRELRDKLLRAAGDDRAGPEVDALLDQLCAQGHLSDARFVESRVHARHDRFGNRRIEQELRRHGVTPDAELQQRLRASEPARAREVWRKKFGQLAGDASGRARQARFLAARGFSADVVHKIVSGDHDDESSS